MVGIAQKFGQKIRALYNTRSFWGLIYFLTIPAYAAIYTAYSEHFISSTIALDRQRVIEKNGILEGLNEQVDQCQGRWLLTFNWLIKDDASQIALFVEIDPSSMVDDVFLGDISQSVFFGIYGKETQNEPSPSIRWLDRDPSRSREDFRIVQENASVWTAAFAVWNVRGAALNYAVEDYVPLSSIARNTSLPKRSIAQVFVDRDYSYFSDLDAIELAKRVSSCFHELAGFGAIVDRFVFGAQTNAFIERDLFRRLVDLNVSIQDGRDLLDNRFWRMLYLSTITITTLGYGDIIPTTDLSRALVASQSILRVILIGLFFNRLVS